MTLEKKKRNMEERVNTILIKMLQKYLLCCLVKQIKNTLLTKKYYILSILELISKQKFSQRKENHKRAKS